MLKRFDGGYVVARREQYFDCEKIVDIELRAAVNAAAARSRVGMFAVNTADRSHLLCCLHKQQTGH